MYALLFALDEGKNHFDKWKVVCKCRTFEKAMEQLQRCVKTDIRIGKQNSAYRIIDLEND